MVTEENWRQAQNTGTAEDQQHPPHPWLPSIKPKPSFHHRGGSLSSNFLLPNNHQALPLHTVLSASPHSIPPLPCYQNHCVLL